MPSIRIMTINGVRDTFTNHCRRYDVSPATAYRRAKKYRMSLEEAITLFKYDVNGYRTKKNCRPHKWYTYTGKPFTAAKTGKKVKKGERHTIDGWSEVTGIKKSTLFGRINRKDFNAAVSEPLDEKISMGMQYHVNWEVNKDKDNFQGLNWDSYYEDKE